MKRSEIKAMQALALEFYQKAGIALTNEEKERIEIADFGLDDFQRIGLSILTYVNTDRVCAKEMVLLPHQTCPEHMHVPTNGMAGKEETFRCRYGAVYLYTATDQEATADTIHAPLSPTPVTVFNETVLHPGEQFTIYPETLHWFCAGEEGAVISEFSTRSTDESDQFTDSRILRMPQIEED